MRSFISWSLAAIMFVIMAPAAHAQFPWDDDDLLLPDCAPMAATCQYLGGIPHSSAMRSWRASGASTALAQFQTLSMGNTFIDIVTLPGMRGGRTHTSMSLIDVTEYTSGGIIHYQGDMLDLSTGMFNMLDIQLYSTRPTKQR